ncbi:MAG TPA: kelch repeat-containing protein [Puia sp.]|nr:kelch repeat-containing protein [Puia sp.]
MRRAIYSLALLSPVILFLPAASCHKTSLPFTQTGNWIQSAQIGSYPRSNAVSFVIGDFAYVGTGYNSQISTTRLSDFWRFSVDSGWKQVENMPGDPRSNAVGFSLGTHGYVGTGVGSDGRTVYNDFYQYDPSLNQWTQKRSFPGDPRMDALGFGLQGKGYIGTGYSYIWLNDFYQYDEQSDTWALTIGTAGQFTKRRAATSFIYKNKAYIVTGAGSGSLAKDFWSFDPSLPQPWTRLGDIISDNTSAKDDQYIDIQRQYAVSFVNGDSAYLTLGENLGTGSVNSTWVYDFSHDQWAQRTAYHRQPRSGAVAFTISGRSFVGTGNSGGSAGALDDFDEFVPYQPYNQND